MSFLKYLTENSGAYEKFAKDYQEATGEQAPSPNKFMSLMNRRAYREGQDQGFDFATKWLLSKGFMQQKGGLVAPTPKGSSLRQSLSAPANGSSSLKKAADGGYKDLRRYFQNVTDEATRDALSKLDEDTLKALDSAKDIDQEDIAILNGIRQRAQNHRERQSLINSMMDKNPERLERLIKLGFIDDKTYAFNKSNWDSFVGKINALDPALIKAVVPKFYEWSTHSSGNTARNINSVLFAIHPQSRNRTAKGEAVWDMLSNLDDATIAQFQNGRKPRQGDMPEEQYNLLTGPVAAIVRSFPEVKTSQDLMDRIEKEFNSRVDFKSLDRSADKTSSRRQGVRDTLRQY